MPFNSSHKSDEEQALDNTINNCIESGYIETEYILDLSFLGELCDVYAEYSKDKCSNYNSAVDAHFMYLEDSLLMDVICLLIL